MRRFAAAAAARCRCCIIALLLPTTCCLHQTKAHCPHPSSPPLTTTKTTTTESCIDVVRSHLPPAALCALRLVSRAARDELVDGRCTALNVWPRLHNSAAPALPVGDDFRNLHSLARLRGLASLRVVDCSCYLSLEDCDELAAALARLPNPLALTALDLGTLMIGYRVVTVHGDDGDAEGGALAVSLWRLIAGVAAVLPRFQALRSLRFAVESKKLPEVSQECFNLLLAATSRLPALVELGAAYNYLGEDDSDDEDGAASLQLSVSAEQLPLRRLRALELTRAAAAALFPVLLTAAVASTLTALRALTVDLWLFELESLSELWSAPWLPQLTRLELKGMNRGDDGMDDLFAALPDDGAFAWAPAPLLRSIIELTVALDEDCGGEARPGLLSADGLRRLLAAANPATLEALVLDDCQEGAAAVLAAHAGAFTALRRLRLDGRDFRRSATADGSWHAMQLAPFAQLESLDICCAHWLFFRPERLGALLSAPWAASLVELTLQGSDQPLQAQAFAALSALPALRRLLLDEYKAGPSGCWALRAPEVEDAIERGFFAGLAARLTELTIRARSADTRVLAALGSVRFERLERLSFQAWEEALLLFELRVLGADGAAWLARLARLELCAWRTKAYVKAAARDPDGPLRALHRGGGKLVCG